MNLQYGARGFFGSARAAFLSQKIRVNEATDGAPRPREAILPCTLIGPWSSPENSKAARTFATSFFMPSENRIA